jgi:prepilin-type N-terminal cleavage/methylation domain-containing protein
VVKTNANHQKSRLVKTGAGFTIIELVVGLAVFALLASGVISAFLALSTTVKQAREKTVLASLASSNLKTVYANDNVVELELQNPIMASSDELLISGQIERGQSIKTVTLNMESPGTFAIQPEFTGLFTPIDDDGYVRTKLYKCSFVSFDSKGSKTFSAGVTANGNLIYVEDSIISSDQSIQFKLIEGDPNSSELTDPKVYIDNTNYYGLVSKGYVGILATLSDDIIILYVYGNSSTNISNYAIYMRIINGAHISDPILIFSFNDYFESQNIFLSPPPINQISMTRNDIFEFGNEFYAAFDCGNKVFFFKLLYDQKHATVLDLAIIYGNLILSNDNNDQKFIDGLNLLINKGLLNKLSFSTQSEEAIYSNNLDGSQRVGLIDFDGVYIGVQFLDSNKIMEVVFDKSYAIPAELREIGTILG